MYPYGWVGNCQVSALISAGGSVDWLCLPRPDSDPVFGRLLDPEGGHFSVSIAGESPALGSQHYLENTNVLVTELAAVTGERIRITDFCPRFENHGRMYRPPALIRKIEPLSGSPLMKVECRPVDGWSRSLMPIVTPSSITFTILRGELSNSVMPSTN